MTADVDALPPTQYLALEVLAARHRLGEHLWTFPTNIRPALEALALAGLVGWKGGATHGTVRAWLTETGRAAVLAGSYSPPVGVQVSVPRRVRLNVSTCSYQRRTTSANGSSILLSAGVDSDTARRSQQTGTDLAGSA